MKRFRLKEQFSYYVDSPPTWIVEKRLWWGWKDASGSYYRTSFTYEEASTKLNNLVQQEERRQENALRLKHFAPKVLYPPLPDEEPVGPGKGPVDRWGPVRNRWNRAFTVLG